MRRTTEVQSIKLLARIVLAMAVTFALAQRPQQRTGGLMERIFNMTLES